MKLDATDLHDEVQEELERIQELSEEGEWDDLWNGQEDPRDGAEGNATLKQNQEFIATWVTRVQETWECNLWVQWSLHLEKERVDGDRKIKVFLL